MVLRLRRNVFSRNVLLSVFLVERVHVLSGIAKLIMLICCKKVEFRCFCSVVNSIKLISCGFILRLVMVA